MSTAVIDKPVVKDPDLARMEARVAARKSNAAAAGLQPTKSRKAFKGAESKFDAIAQGDVIPKLMQEPAIGYVEGTPFEVDMSLIPDGYEEILDIRPEHLRMSGTADTIGNRHIMASSKGVRMWRPKVYDPESLVGPILALQFRTEVDHPTHGTFSLAPGSVVKIRYPREYDSAMKAIRKATD